MAKRAEKKAADNKQVQIPAQGTEISENRDLSTDVRQEEPAEKIPDAGTQQAQHPSPDLGMEAPETMNQPGETQDGSEEQADAGVQHPFPDPGMKVSETMDPPAEMQERSGKMEDVEMQQFLSDLEDDQQEEQAGQSDKQHATTYRITCRNKISKVIGGVSFVDGVGYTSDGFTASWFGNKDGYEVKEAGS